MSEFTKLFLEKYLAAGMGAMTKRDIDALVMYLLDEHGKENGHPLKTLSNQQASVELRTPVSKIKALRYEATLKYKQHSTHHAQWKFLEVLARAQFDAEKQKIAFIIEDSFTRHWFQAELKRHGFVFDNSFNAEIVRADVDSLCAALWKLYDQRSVSALEKSMRAAVDKNAKFSFKDAKKEFLKGAASGLGEWVTPKAIAELIALV
jgi:hypothetical protein